MLHYKAKWPLHTRQPFRGFLLGWWLTGLLGVSGSENDPRPSISVSPTGVVPLGGNVTIHCTCGISSDVTWHLTKHNREPGHTVEQKTEQTCVVVFSISNAQLSNAGLYSCRYCVRDPCSDFSNKVSINITDPSLPQPSIQMNLRGKNTSGLNVTITCQGPKNGLMFALYNSREQIAFQAAEPKKNTTIFSISLVRSEDARNYRCQYRQKGKAFVWSEPSDPTELELEVEVEDTAIAKWASIAAGLLLLVLLLALIAFVLHRKKRRGSFVKEESQPVNKPSEPGRDENPEDVSYAVLNHKSWKPVQMSSPNTVSESCVYATVVKD
nr:immunoglobulin superfamily member 1-like isoform X2 [Pogona vitticeps]